MMLDRPQSLGKSVAVTATNRPIKIAYLVPYEESSINHLILDAVFYESYTRWTGLYTLIVPVNVNGFMAQTYKDWLGYHDPDFIYTYITLDDDFKREIERVYSPIAFLEHKLYRDASDITWWSLLPNWKYYFSAISSITTIHSPHVRNVRHGYEKQNVEVTILTQYERSSDERFISDNFGASFNISSVSNPVPGLFKTLCFVKSDISNNLYIGSERISSVNEGFNAIKDRSALSIASLAMAHSEGLPKVRNYEYSFNLIIGNSIQDRINFWNSRLFSENSAKVPCSLIVEPSFLDDDMFVRILGEYLNANSFSHGGRPATTQIRSLSLEKNDLELFAKKLQEHTSNLINVCEIYNVWVYPKHQYLKGDTFRRDSDNVTFKVIDNDNVIRAALPEHYAFIAPQYKGNLNGNWIVMHDIERHNNHSQYSNVVDKWVLPKRQKLAGAFTNTPARVSNGGKLSLIPMSSGTYNSQPINTHYIYDLRLPDDEGFFNHLLSNYPINTLKEHFEQVNKPGYETIAISDKGQNLRGIISMFESLSSAYKVLTNKYWREVIRTAKDESVRYLTFDINKLESYLPNDKETCDQLKADLGFDNISSLKKYMKASMLDTLESLVRQKVFFQVHEWRCDYCGHANCKSFDDMRTRNCCEICSNEYFAPVDIRWVFQLNGFVHRTLVKQHGLPVLWALGFIQNNIVRGNFWYLPEVDLYENQEQLIKKEIDLLCIADGKFYAIEVKVTASQFQKAGEVKKFIDKISRIQPDVAMLIFERYCQNDAELPSIQKFLDGAFNEIQTAIGQHIKLEKIIANDVREFNDYPRDLGYFGYRGWSFHDAKSTK